MQHIPYEHYSLSVEFGSAPDRVDELVAAVFKVFDEIKAGTVSDSNLTKIQEIQLRGTKPDSSRMRTGSTR